MYEKELERFKELFLNHLKRIIKKSHKLFERLIPEIQCSVHLTNHDKFSMIILYGIIDNNHTQIHSGRKRIIYMPIVEFCQKSKSNDVYDTESFRINIYSSGFNALFREYYHSIFKDIINFLEQKIIEEF